MIVNKYHINDKTKKVGICRALDIRSCPFHKLGGDHFNSRSDANKALEKRIREGNDTFAKITRSPSQEFISFSRRVSNYKTSKSLVKAIEESLQEFQEGKHNDPSMSNQELLLKKLIIVSNNKYVDDKVAALLSSFRPDYAKGIAKRTTNPRVLEFMAMSDNAYVSKEAMSNPHIDVKTLYITSLVYHKKDIPLKAVERLNKYGFSTEHCNNRQKDANNPQVVEIEALNNIVNCQDKIRSRQQSNPESFYNELASKEWMKSDPAALSYLVKKTVYKSIVTERSRYYKKIIESVPHIDYNKDAWDLNTKKSHQEKNLMDLKQFKNTVPMASYEDAIKLQERWEKGLEELPIDMKREVLNKQYDTTESGLRAVVDLFKTTSQKGSQVQSGLDNFLNHIDKMKERDAKKGYIAVDEPEFKTPLGIVRVEEHVGNYDYGERVTFRLNTDKFIMSKQMLSHDWSTFIHVRDDIPSAQNNTGTDIIPAKKKGFFARLKDLYLPEETTLS